MIDFRHSVDLGHPVMDVRHSVIELSYDHAGSKIVLMYT